MGQYDQMDGYEQVNSIEELRKVLTCTDCIVKMSIKDSDSTYSYQGSLWTTLPFSPYFIMIIGNQKYGFYWTESMKVYCKGEALGFNNYDYIVVPQKYDTHDYREKINTIVYKATKIRTNAEFFENQKLMFVTITDHDCILVTNRGSIMYIGNYHLKETMYKFRIKNFKLQDDNVKSLIAVCNSDYYVKFDNDIDFRYLNTLLDDMETDYLLKTHMESAFKRKFFEDDEEQPEETTDMKKQKNE